MRILISLLFVVCLCVGSAFGQKGIPGTPDNRIGLKAEISPTTFPSQTPVPLKGLFSFSNENPNSSVSVQKGDSFVIRVADRFFILLAQDQSPLVVNSTNLQASDFQVTRTQGQITITYNGNTAVFAPGDTIALKLDFLTVGAGASNISFEVPRKGAENFYNPTKQFVRINAVDFPLATPPTPRAFSFRLNQTEQLCISQPGTPAIQGLQAQINIPNEGGLLLFGKLQLSRAPTSNNPTVTALIFIDGVQVGQTETEILLFSLGPPNTYILRADALVPISAGSHVIQITAQSNEPVCFDQGELIGIVF